MTIEIPTEFERFISEQVRLKNYRSVSEVVRHALLLLQAQHAGPVLFPDEIRAAITEGLESLETEEAVDGERFFNQLEESCR